MVPSLPTISLTRFFPDIHCEKLVEFLEAKLTNLTGNPWSFLISLMCPHWTSSNSSVTFSFSYPDAGSSEDLLMGSYSGIFLLYYSPLCLSNLKTSLSPYDLTSLVDLRRVVDFSFCAASYFLLGWSGNLWIPDMLDQESEISSNHLMM